MSQGVGLASCLPKTAWPPTFEIVSGLKEGEKIVAGTYQAIRELKDGAVVREAKTDAKKPPTGTKT